MLIIVIIMLLQIKFVFNVYKHYHFVQFVAQRLFALNVLAINIIYMQLVDIYNVIYV